jgi:biotin carboxyl carrier protein
MATTGQQHDVTIAEGRERGVYDVAVGQIRIPVRRPAPGRRSRRGPRDGPEGPQRVCAPMPGKIVRVLVAVGDQVAARQGVVVVEAMKMENELRASRAGVVCEVLVSEGASVESGAPLVIIG